MYFSHKTNCFLTLFLALAISASAQRKLEIPGDDDPALIPDRIVTGFSGDPSTQFTVSWHTDDEIAKPMANILESTAETRLIDQATTVTATSVRVEMEGKTVNYHEATFDNLKPSTSYMYRVGGDKVWSEWFDFKTASDKPAPFKFIYFGDPQIELKSKWSRAIRNAFLHAPDAALFVIGGDLVNQGYVDGYWEEFGAAASFLTAIRPSLPTPGNHETTGSQTIRKKAGSAPASQPARDVTPIWQAQFEMPENAPTGYDTLKEETYYIDYQGVRFISLNTNAYMTGGDSEKAIAQREAQNQWLKDALKNNPGRWTVVMHHHPVFSFGQQRDNLNLRKTLAPLYEEYGVDLVLTGHDHVYARSHKIAEEKIADPAAKAPIYVVSVSGPKLYKANPKFEKIMAKTLTNTQMYQVIEVDGDTLKYNAYSIDGQLQDAFELQKSEESSKYVNMAK